MDYKSPKLTVDGALIEDKKILLIKRKNEPFKNKWALPGGFVEYGETVENAVKREVFEETGLITDILELIGIYSDPKRDPRGHTVSVVYLLEKREGSIKSGDDATEAKFFSLDKLPEMSFDHGIILSDVVKRIDRNVLS